MTNRIALALGLLVLLGFILDRAVNDGAGLLFLARKFIDLVDWLQFWR